VTLPLPPGPKGLPFLGSSREVSADKLGATTRFQREHGSVVALRMGPLRVAMVSDPSLIEQVLVNGSRRVRKGVLEQLIRPAAGNGIFLSEDDFWKRQRRMVSPPFHRARLLGYGETMVSVAERVAEGWKHGEVRDVYRDTSHIGLAVAAKVLFDVDVEAQAGQELGRALTAVMDGVTARVNSLLPLPDVVPTPTMLRLKAAVRRLDALLYEAIARRRAGPGDREDLLSLLLAARDEDDGRGMTDRQLRDEAMTLFVAGFETTAINLAWTLDLLARHPDVEQEVRAELDRVLAGRRPTAADLPELPAVERVVKESLRLYPPAWAMDRLAQEDLELGGFRVPKGWDIWMFPWVVHRDPRWWPDPDRFHPARWASEEVKKLPRFAFFPFGGGPRICIGNTFAMMEAQLVLATLLPRFTFRPVGPPPTPDPGFTLRPRPAVTLRVEDARRAP
jgi:cytochrome P450